MLHQCGHQSSATPCSCGFAYGGCGGGSGGGAGGASFSFLFPVTAKQYVDQDLDAMDSSCSSPSLVDCTLSLATPSTRRSDRRASATAAQSQPPSCMSNLCWDIISQSKSSSLGTNASNAVASFGGDPLLLARRCANCDTTSTPLWRNGPRGPKSLCNACGIRYKKEERRAAASTVPPSPSQAAAEQVVGFGYHHRQHPSPWSCYASDSGDAPYLSWQFNLAPSSQFPVRDRPSLFQYN